MRLPDWPFPGGNWHAAVPGNRTGREDNNQLPGHCATIATCPGRPLFLVTGQSERTVISYLYSLSPSSPVLGQTSATKRSAVKNHWQRQLVSYKHAARNHFSRKFKFVRRQPVGVGGRRCNLLCWGAPGHAINTGQWGIQYCQMTTQESDASEVFSGR